MMNRQSVVAEWRRAQASLRAAAVCLRSRCYADAVSRAYYAVFHSAKAALQIHNGTTAGTHGAVRMLFGQHLIQTGVIERQWGSEIGRLYDLRLKADYDIQETFTQVLAGDAYARAERYLERIMQFLTGSLSFPELIYRV